MTEVAYLGFFMRIVTMRKFVLPLSVLFVLAALLLSPARYFASVQKGVLLFSSSVLPSMLPYFFFTKVLTMTGCVTALAGTVGRPVAKLYRTDPIAAYPFLMSFLSGYPVGARVLADVYEKGLICKEDAARAASFCSTSGSMFVLGSVGAVVLKDAGAGAVILVAHYLGAVLNGFFYRGKKRRREAFALPDIKRSDNVLSEAMYESVLSLALVGGFIAVANLLGDVVFDVLTKAGAGGALHHTTLGAFFYSVFEVTRGCVEFSLLGAKRVWTAAFCCFAVSFGGLSVLLQSIAFLGKTGLKFSKFLLIKFTQAALSFGLCVPIGFLFLN